jgi:hypothetical protein
VFDVTDSLTDEACFFFFFSRFITAPQAGRPRDGCQRHAGVGAGPLRVLLRLRRVHLCNLLPGMRARLGQVQHGRVQLVPQLPDVLVLSVPDCIFAFLLFRFFLLRACSSFFFFLLDLKRELGLRD